MKGLMDGEESPLKKMQIKMIRLYENFKENRMAEEWDLYIKKSEIINSRSSDFL